MTPMMAGGFTPSHAGGMTPGGATHIGSAALAMMTPAPGHMVPMTPDQMAAYRYEKEIDDRNRPLSDEELDGLFPPGYKILQSFIVDDLKDENEMYRKMVMETIENIVSMMGSNEIDSRLEEQLIDDILHAFQERSRRLVDFLMLLCSMDSERSNAAWANEPSPTSPKIPYLPHLKSLVEIVEGGLVDEQQKVRTITALCLAALAEASTPYGMEAFDTVLKPLWKGIRTHRGNGLAAYLKAIGYLISLMDADYSSYYTHAK